MPKASEYDSVVYRAQDSLEIRSNLMKDLGQTVPFEEFGTVWTVDPVPDFWTIDQVKFLADAVHDYMVKVNSTTKSAPAIREAKRATNSYAGFGGIGLVKKNGRFNGITVIHELTHHYFSGSHGLEFVEGMKELLSEFVSSGTAQYFQVLVFREADVAKVRLR